MIAVNLRGGLHARLGPESRGRDKYVKLYLAFGGESGVGLACSRRLYINPE